MPEHTHDTVECLRCYLTGYDQGYEFGMSGGDPLGDAALGGADARSAGSSPVLPSVRAVCGPASVAPGDPPGAASGEGVEEALHVHRGIILGLRALQEAFADLDMDEAARITEQTAQYVAASQFRRLV